MCEIILDNLYIPNFHSHPTSAAGGGDFGGKFVDFNLKKDQNKINKRTLRLKY